ncbi:TatD family hydrolase [Candidatus Micrarchaeota archaeon]|nr:TatD family hydrolase [Candidatus Micrarchaeota archaeon]
MEFIDAHCHLEHPRFDADVGQVIQCAKNAGLAKVVDAGSNLLNNRKILSLREKNPGFLECVLGCSPHDANKADVEAELSLVKQNSGGIVGIGEIGLEYHYFKTEGERGRQIEVFEAFLNLAQELNKPAVIHSREAGDLTVKLCEKYGVKTLMHCSLDPKLALAASEKGFTISVPALKSSSKSKVIKNTPIEQLVCETDSPFLWRQGERNEPANVISAYAQVAQIKGLEIEEAAQQLTLNAKAFYNI